MQGVGPDRGWCGYGLTITVRLSAGSNWSELTLIEKRVRENKANELVTGGGLDLSKDPGTDPNASIMNLMQKMYNSGDSQMKQIISKAWTEGEEKRRAGME